MDDKDNAAMDDKDDTIYYFIANSIAYLGMFAVCVFVVINLIESVIVRICVLPVLFFLCGYLEQWVVSGFVNVLLEKVLDTITKILKSKQP